ncbi:MAG: hypothetical protein CSA83_01005 [Actinomycetales bacterium]|nr:MAG: hypothetical protein CSA83_01005 [Actinomycetales bacterium]
MWKSILSQLQSFVVFHRRAFAAGAAALAVFTTLQVLAPADNGITIYRLKSEVSAGHTIGVKDLVAAKLPQDAIPADALTGEKQLLGKTAAVRLSKHTIITPGLLAENKPPDGMRHVPVRITDTALLNFLSPGDQVAVFGVGEQGELQTLTEKARVVANPPSAETVFSDSQNSLLILEVPAAAAVKVAAASLQRSVSLVLR